MTNEQDYGGDLCKNHSARSEKEFCRVCPSNLNKKELENVYFTLLENNLDLKTTINSQREKIKILSTKVQRLTALQKTYLGKEPKECCGSKALIHEQKECISDLRRANQRLSERVRQLNMRLCSAKQFLKKSPFQSTSRCNRCSNKNVSMSALITKRSETNLRSTTASGQYLAKDIMSSRTADNNIISLEKGVQYDFCDENKCRDRIEELRNKNMELEEQLVQTWESHGAVTSQLERAVTELRVEAALGTERADRLRDQLGEATARLAGAGLRCDELTVELAAERHKVAELETRLRAADVSARIASAIETHLAGIKLAKDHANVFKEIETGVFEKSSTDDISKFLSVQSPSYKPKAAARTKFLRNSQLEEVFKSPDDSGYTEVTSNRSQDADETKTSTYINQVLLEKIADLQNQINKLKAFKNSYNNNNDLNLTQEINIANTEEVFTALSVNHIDENIISESSESVTTEKKVTSNNVTTQVTISDAHNNFPPKVKPLNPVRDDKGDNNTAGQQSDSNKYNKFSESFNHFKRRSIDFSCDNNAPASDSRKLSLQSSKSYLEKNNLTKTGSLDENRVSHVDSAKGDRKKRHDIENLSVKSFYNRQISKSNNDTIPDAETLNVSDKSIQYNIPKEVKESNKESQNMAIIENPGENIAYYTKNDKKKDSDSSNGTYTIKKDENVLKLKSEPNNALRNEPDGNKTHKISYAAADVKTVLNKASSKEKLVPRRKSPASDSRTYTKAPRDVSPESTECEISSMSDLPSERDGWAGSSRSPGEERPPTASPPPSTRTTTDYGSLSEGELPYARDATILSDGEKRRSNRPGKSHSVPQMEPTLAAVRTELARCSRLLRGRARRSLDPPGAR